MKCNECRNILTNDKYQLYWKWYCSTNCFKEYIKKQDKKKKAK